MSVASILTITRREVRETLTDWRILIPIGLLTLILPQLLVISSRLVIRFVEDAALTGRLVPFAALLVGFIPSSFSLITALESFVGERERNSLESLLAMPVSDNELYIGKLCSALFTPLVASYLAMLVFTSLLYAVDPRLFLDAITASRLVLLFLMVGLLALAMVAGAVVISTHTSSIRAANLLSSLVLIPASLVVQAEAFLIINSRWDVLWIIIAALAVLVIVLMRFGLASFNREEILSREHQQVDLGPLTVLLNLSGNEDRRRTKDEGAAQPFALRPSSFIAPVVTVAAREIRETLTDWRILLPIVILAIAVPLALVAGTGFAIEFVGDVKLVSRLVPFAVLLIGFIPGSFSLITALESFVGERERNSLESLLAMPVSDGQLYLAKLFSSLLTPLFTSYGAMLVFSAALAWIFPDLYFSTMTGVRLFQLMLMIGVMTLVMVSGAVIISSHTSSIRAATLLASFVLIPMSVMLMLESLLVIATRWDVMWIIIEALVVVAIALARTGMAAFNREEILSREHEQFNLGRIEQTFKTFFAEYQPAGVAPNAYQRKRFSPRRFYRHELPRLLRDYRLPLIVALIAAVSGLVAGGYVGNTYRIRALNQFLAQVGYAPSPSLALVLGIFANNLRVSLLANLFSSFVFGLFAVLVPAVAFAQIGFVSSTLHSTGGSWFALGPDSPLQFVLAYVLPHGIIELPTFILSTALGVRIGASLMAPPRGFTVAQNMLWSLANFLKVWLLVLLPLILIGALVEGLVTPMIIRGLYGSP